MPASSHLPSVVLLAALAAAPCIGAQASCPGPGTAADHALRPGGAGLAFDVLRNGKRVGRHVTRFALDDGYLVVVSEMTLRIRFLFIDAYRYRYAATERWCDGRLVDLESSVDANGERTAVTARVRGDQLVIVGPQGSSVAPLGLYSTNHWHAGVLEARTVLNTLTGRINRVSIAQCATPQPGGEGPAQGRCYEYHGDLRARVWYDRDNRWVGLAFDGEDGSRFEYRCTNCVPGRAPLDGA